MKSFSEFPKNAICPVCKTNNNKPCYLLPVIGTETGDNIQAQPVHVDCVQAENMWYSQMAGRIVIVDPTSEFVSSKKGN